MTMSLSLARPIVAEPGGLSGVSDPGRIAWIILVAKLPESGGLLIAGGAISVFGASLIGGAAGGSTCGGEAARGPGRPGLAASARRRGVAVAARVLAGRAPARRSASTSSAAAGRPHPPGAGARTVRVGAR